MFILYAIPVGVAIGWLLRGRLENLSAIRVRLGPLAIAALLVQVALFAPPAGGLPDAVARAIYVGSTAAVLVVVIANLRLTAVPLIALGAIANLAAIVANGGAMPADPDALAVAGISLASPSNSIRTAEPALRPLTDIFAIPSAVPLANVFSIGDVLIGLGLAMAIAAAMRSVQAAPADHQRSS